MSVLAPPLNPQPPSAYRQPHIDQFTNHSENSRRPGFDPRLRAPSSTAISDLDSVPEDSLSHSTRPSSSTLRAGAKGKERQSHAAILPRGGSSDTFPDRRKRAEWVVDLVQTRRGADAWGERDRVVLVLGREPTSMRAVNTVGLMQTSTPDPTADALAPILYDPVFANTLLLVGSTEPIPSIEALLSPTHLLSSSPDRAIHPTLHPFTIAPGVDAVHTLPPLLAQATGLASNFRTRSSNAGPVWIRRRGSSDSASSTTPPLTPPTRSRRSSGFSPYLSSPNGSFDSYSGKISPSPSSIDLPPRIEMKKSTSGASLSGSRESSRPSARSRLSASFSQSNIFGGLAKWNDKSTTALSNGGSPFDAVVNFMPRASEFKPERALQDMLHQAVVLTTAVLPIVARKGPSSPSDQALPISLLHVLPSQVPGPLPSVIESFLLSFIPSFAHRGDREVWTSVLSTPAWLEQRVDVLSRNFDSPEELSGAEVLLFGGLRCPIELLEDQGEAGDYKPRAFLSSWESCMRMPGLLAEARRPTESRPPTVIQRTETQRRESRQPEMDRSAIQQPKIEPSKEDIHTPVARQPSSRTKPAVQRLPSDPPSISYSDMRSRTPPSTEKPSPTSSDQDASQSSCSSWSGGETGSWDQGEGRQLSPPQQVPGKIKKGLASWLKGKTRVMRV